MSIVLPAMRGVLSRLGYRSAVMADNPIAYWRLGEASGTTAVDEKGLYNGTYVGGPTLGVAGAVAGNTAVTFNGSSQYVKTSSASQLNPGTNSFSVETWFYLNTSNLSPLIFKGNSTSLTDGYAIFYENSNVIVRCNSGGGTTYRASQSISGVLTGQWYHVVLVINRTSNVIIGYLNGSNSGWVNGGGGPSSNSISGFPSISNTTDLTIGYNTTPTFFSGRSDEVAIYDKALSAERILAHYNARISP